jgi:hypothetical protein
LAYPSWDIHYKAIKEASRTIEEENIMELFPAFDVVATCR